MTPKTVVLIMAAGIGAIFLPMFINGIKSSGFFIPGNFLSVLFVLMFFVWIWGPIVIGVLLWLGRDAVKNGHEKVKSNTSIFQPWMILGGLAAIFFVWMMHVLSGDYWKEDVLLHDGTVIVVERSQIYGTSWEIGKRPGIARQTITFTMPNKEKIVRWQSEEPFDGSGYPSLELLALHIKNGAPYIVTLPNGCLSYNKWGRPDPPYVIFKYDGTTWHRIQLNELPIEFMDMNVLIDPSRYKEVRSIAGVHFSTKTIKALNENKSIKRESLAQYFSKNRDVLIVPSQLDKWDYWWYSGVMSCDEMIEGEGGWIKIDTFSSRSTYEECLEVCGRNKVRTQNCPCNRLFKRM